MLLRTAPRGKAILVHRLDGTYRSDLLVAVLVVLDCSSSREAFDGVSSLRRF